MDTLDIQVHGHLNAMHVVQKHVGIPCMSTQLMLDILKLKDALCGFDYVLFSSDNESAFNLGGDLRLFIECIEDGDRDRLTEYAYLCIKAVHLIHSGFDMGVRSIACIEGDALGGGFEGALACHEIHANQYANVGMPEANFGMFPGMGAASFLTKRVGKRTAHTWMTNGLVQHAYHYPKTVVSKSTAAGNTINLALETIEARRKRSRSSQLVRNALQEVDLVSYAELSRVVDVWVEAAMRLPEENLKRMKLIHRAQRVTYSRNN